MTGEELKAIRLKLGLSVVQMGRALGYAGDDKSVDVQIRRFEANMREIPPAVGRLAIMFKRYGIPRGFL